MSLEEEKEPAPPALRPIGPIVSGAQAELWADAVSAVDAARRHGERTRRWARLVLERAKRRGRAEGRAAGLAEAARLAAAVATEAEQFRNQLERELPKLVLDLVERITGALEPNELMLRSVRHALSKVGAGADVRLRVCAALAEDLRAALKDLAETSGAPALRVEADPALEPGACVLWSEFGNVDLSVEAQLRALRQGFDSLAAPSPGEAAGGTRPERLP